MLSEILNWQVTRKGFWGGLYFLILNMLVMVAMVIISTLQENLRCTDVIKVSLLVIVGSFHTVVVKFTSLDGLFNICLDWAGNIFASVGNFF